MRLPPLPPDSLDADQRSLYDAVTTGPRASGSKVLPLTDADGHLLGPFDPMLRSPGIGAALEQLGAALRYRSTLTDRARELATLLVAQRRDSGFERWAHRRLGRAAGLSEDELTTLDRGTIPELPDPRERAVASVTAALLDRGDLDDAEYAAALDLLGVGPLVELIALVGHYSSLALLMRVCRIEAPDPDTIVDSQ